MEKSGKSLGILKWMISDSPVDYWKLGSYYIIVEYVYVYSFVFFFNRLWGDHGQSALETARVCLINATATGTEILKNLILPGIGSFTVIDGDKVQGEDAGNKYVSFLFSNIVLILKNAPRYIHVNSCLHLWISLK